MTAASSCRYDPAGAEEQYIRMATRETQSERELRQARSISFLKEPKTIRKRRATGQQGLFALCAYTKPADCKSMTCWRGKTGCDRGKHWSRRGRRGKTWSAAAKEGLATWHHSLGCLSRQVARWSLPSSDCVHQSASQRIASPAAPCQHLSARAHARHDCAASGE